MFKKATVVLFLITFASFVSANPTCTGYVSSVSLTSTGGVIATVKGSEVNLADVVLCSSSATTGAFAGHVCDSVYSMLLSAVAMSEDVTLWFYQEKFSSCSLNWANLGDYGFYHFRLNK